METRTIDLETADGPMRAYEAEPDAPVRGGVIVIQEAFGLNHHIEDVARRFATEGYRAIAPELFHRSEEPGPIEYGDLANAVALMAALSDDGMLADVDACAACLGAVGIEAPAVGIVGFCMGGRVTFLVAARRALGAAIGYYGGGIVTARMPQLAALVGEAATLRTPWLGLFGDDDQSIPIDEVEALRAALEAAPVDHDVVRYPHAGHAFFCDARPSYVPEAAADAWPRTLAWLETHLSR